jgi:hypothetical protein
VSTLALTPALSPEERVRVRASVTPDKSTRQFSGFETTD